MFYIILSILLITAEILVYIFSKDTTKIVFKPKPKIIPFVGGNATVLWPNDLSSEVAGAGCGVAVFNNGDILYLQRVGYSFFNQELIPDPVVFRIDPISGLVKSKWGGNFFAAPHSITTDSQNNVWISDTSLNKVFKFDIDGKLLLTVGRDYSSLRLFMQKMRVKWPRFPSFKNPYYFAMPTGIVVSKNGDFTVADGYKNSRIVKFDANGKFIWQVNKKGSGNKAFNLTHGITQDDQDNIYVADRSNARIQKFSKNGEWLDTWDNNDLGRPFSLQVGPDQLLYVVDGGDVLETRGKDTDPRSQIIIMTLKGEILKRWGVYGSKLGELMIPHDVAVAKNGNIFVAELKGNRLQKFEINQLKNETIDI
ncbi:MAG: peptidylamidoglycolate lyase [Saccharospirillaceae bacterium]|nr:peptidyl-alpha-hydroxyglycine alpha-amidating lyase family protein [Pseudomonadales bacterium]NRB79884.1 peptidylamidoglycolate lyase [Saccharospirillaceae bacterium]